MTPSAAKLRMEGVCQERGGKNRRRVLHEVSLQAPAGAITAIVGPSGGGKSTLVRLLNRLEDPVSGRIFLNSVDIATLDPLLLRRRIGLMPQQPFMFSGSVLFNLQQPFRLQGAPLPPAEDPRLARVLEICRLPAELLLRDARRLSLGQQQRVSLARTLLTEPEVLLLDEPTSALDRPTGDRLAATIREICRTRELVVVLVTHDLRLAQHAADNLVYLEGGRILEQGPAADLLARPRSAALQHFLNGTEAEEGDADERQADY